MAIKKKIIRSVANAKQKLQFATIRKKAKLTRLKQAAAKDAPRRRLRRRLAVKKIKKGVIKGSAIGAAGAGLFIAGGAVGASGQKETSRRKRISKGLKKHHKKKRK